MTYESRRHTERQFYEAYAKDLKERFKSGLLKELLPYPQFVVWKYAFIDNKPKKPPYNPHTHRLADIGDPSTWGTVEQAIRALATGNYNGIGFVLSDNDPFSAIDLDHCTHTNRSIDAWAREIIDFLSTYAEYSPRDGIHLITQGTFPGPGRKLGKIEMFSTNHFLTLTLNHVPGTPVLATWDVRSSNGGKWE